MTECALKGYIMIKKFIKKNSDEILISYIILGVVVTLMGSILFKNIVFLFGLLIHVVVVGMIISIYSPGGGYTSDGW